METIRVTGVAPEASIIVNGVAGPQQVTVTGSVAATGPQGIPGRDGINGSNAEGGGSWGLIEGTLSDQSDLNSALNTKLSATSNLSDVSSAATSRANLGLAIGTNVQAQITPASTTDYYRGDKTFQDLNTAVRTNRLDQMAVAANTLNLGSQRIINLATPTSTGDAATKAYVDSVAQGLSVKTSVVAATTSALPTNTYSAGVITETSSGSLTIDLVSPSTGDRVLIKDEPVASKNGIYVITDTGSVSTPFILTRASDMDTGTEVTGAFAFVVSGTANAGAGYIVANAGPFVIGTTAINWTQFSSSTLPDASTTVKGKALLGAASGAATYESVVNATKSAAYVQLAANPDSIIFGTITRDANEAATSAPVIWPDGTTGTYTADTVSTAFPGAVDAYHITYVGTPTVTYTQPLVTRDSLGAVTVRPAITVV